MRGRQLWSGKIGPLRGMISQHEGWARLFGHGIRWSDCFIPLSFSERKGTKRLLHIGPWRILWLGKRWF